MHAVGIGVAVLAALAIMIVGMLYLTVPLATARTFGLPPPDGGPQIAWWLRLKGSRDVVCGLVVFALLVWGEPHLLGVVLLVLALIPLGDMTIVISGKGSVARALGVHGATAAVMIVGALPLVLRLA